ncbi:MAG: hypothetical protein K8R59_13995 [Thermoanaerobaculales bacterium]|nr:hypothetical protein [Thermoanaerobaculales bacterium]
MIPELDILDGRGEVSQFAPLYVIAAMAHPKDEDCQHRYLASEIVGRMIDEIPERGDIAIGQKLLWALWKCPGPEKTLRRAEDQVERGCVAGDVLLFILNHSVYEGAASVRKAQSVITADMFGARNLGGGYLKGISEITIRRRWSAFRTVAHLWAAIRLTFEPKSSGMGFFRSGIG